MAGSPGVMETLDRVAVAGRAVLNADGATCYRLDPRGTVGMVRTTEPDAARRELIERAVGHEMPMADVLRSRSSPVMAVTDARRSRLVPGEHCERLGAAALMAVRLAHAEMDPGSEGELGWLFLSWSSPRSFTTADRRLGRAFADLGARAVSEAQVRESAQRLRRSEAHLLDAQRMASLGSWSWEIASGHIEWSPEIRRLAGLPETTPPTIEAFLEAVHPDDRERFERACAIAAEEFTPLDVVYRVEHPDGRVRVLHGHGEAVAHDEAGQATWFVGCIQDVTESVETAERLARSEAHLTEAQRIASLGSWVWEIESGQIDWSVEFSRVLGLPETAVPGLDVFFAAVHPDDRERVQLAVSGFVEQSTPLDVVCRVVRPDGTIRVIHSHGEPVAWGITGGPPGTWAPCRT